VQPLPHCAALYKYIEAVLAALQHRLRRISEFQRDLAAVAAIKQHFLLHIRNAH
jgi:hypothetical protein